MQMVNRMLEVKQFQNQNYKEQKQYLSHETHIVKETVVINS